MRLIDVDKIEINEECTFSGKGIKAFLDSIPTAYDVDKVVECLEILSDSADDKIMGEDGSEQYWDGFGDGVDKAIGILKSVGIE